MLYFSPSINQICIYFCVREKWNNNVICKRTYYPAKMIWALQHQWDDQEKKSNQHCVSCSNHIKQHQKSLLEPQKIIDLACQLSSLSKRNGYLMFNLMCATMIWIFPPKLKLSNLSELIENSEIILFFFKLYDDIWADQLCNKKS